MTAPGNRQPNVVLDWSLWCNRHLAPYRAQWPAGAAVAMMRLFDAAVRMPAIVDAAKDKPSDKQADVANLNYALHRFAPLCCFVSSTTMLAIYAETAPGWQQ
jgi:hypothetical protein